MMEGLTLIEAIPGDQVEALVITPWINSEKKAPWAEHAGSMENHINKRRTLIRQLGILDPGRRFEKYQIDTTKKAGLESVSYTHLTLPTSDLV